MIFVQIKQHSLEWIKYLAVALICALVAIDGMSFAFADPGKSGGQYAIADNKGDSEEDFTITMVMKSESVAARLGGYHGILGFLHNFAVPALLADAEVASFFGNLTTTPDDIEQCLAMLLDHDLGGSSKKMVRYLNQDIAVVALCLKFTVAAIYPMKQSRNSSVL